VSGDQLQQLLNGRGSELLGCPVHIHISEQTAEVADCITHTSRRPIDYLFDTAAVDGSWCLVHATHANESELFKIAGSGAVVGLCPTTEANLGDGVFPAAELLALGGRFGIGSDSNVVVDPAHELQLLEYGQRLTSQRRNVLAGSSQLDRHVGRHLLRHAVSGGAMALGQPVGELEVGQRADFCVLDCLEHRSPDSLETDLLFGHGPETVIDGWVFAAPRSPIRDVAVGGKLVVQHYEHIDEARLGQAFVAALGRLRA
jgi:formimidoylglutamate deiminase